MQRLVSPSMFRWILEIKLISPGLHRKQIYLLSHLANLVILDFYLLLFFQLQEILKEHIYGHSKQVVMLLRMKWRPSEIVLILWCLCPLITEARVTKLSCSKQSSGWFQMGGVQQSESKSQEDHVFSESYQGIFPLVLIAGAFLASFDPSCLATEKSISLNSSDIVFFFYDSIITWRAYEDTSNSILGILLLSS